MEVKIFLLCFFFFLFLLLMFSPGISSLIVSKFYTFTCQTIKLLDLEKSFHPSIPQLPLFEQLYDSTCFMGRDTMKNNR